MSDDDSSHVASATSSPLFFFTPAEWSAMCEELFGVLAAHTLSLQLAECERHITVSANMQQQQKQQRVTAMPFRSVFIPQAEQIQRK